MVGAMLCLKSVLLWYQNGMATVLEWTKSRFGIGGESLICWLELAVYGQLVLRRGVVMDQVEIWDWGRIVDLLVGASCVWAACVKEGGSNGPSRDLGLGENH